MSQGLYVKQELVPYAAAGTEIMYVFADHGSDDARAAVYITAVSANTSIQVLTGRGYDTDSYSVVANESMTSIGQKVRVDIPLGADITQQVSVVRILTGHASVATVSPNAVRAEFRTRKHP